MIVVYTWIMDIVEENTADVYNGNHIKGHNYNDIDEEMVTKYRWCHCLPSIIILFFIYDSGGPKMIVELFGSIVRWG